MMNRVETLSFAHPVHLYRLSLKKTAHVITLLLQPFHNGVNVTSMLKR
jgi:hypothetical protein